MELKIQADLNIVHQCACGWIFLNVGFNRVTCREPQGRTIGIDYVISRAQFFRNALGDISESIKAGTSSSVPAFFRNPRDLLESIIAIISDHLFAFVGNMRDQLCECLHPDVFCGASPGHRRFSSSYHPLMHMYEKATLFL
jgi:hypothetical protein